MFLSTLSTILSVTALSSAYEFLVSLSKAMAGPLVAANAARTPRAIPTARASSAAATAQRLCRPSIEEQPLQSREEEDSFSSSATSTTSALCIPKRISFPT